MTASSELTSRYAYIRTNCRRPSRGFLKNLRVRKVHDFSDILTPGTQNGKEVDFVKDFCFVWRHWCASVAERESNHA